jgi:hypothetical protein
LQLDGKKMHKPIIFIVICNQIIRSTTKMMCSCNFLPKSHNGQVAMDGFNEHVFFS